MGNIKMPNKLSQAMRMMLSSAHLYGDPFQHLRGAAEHGGATWTMAALVRRGYMTKKGVLTTEGEAVRIAQK